MRLTPTQYSKPIMLKNAKNSSENFFRLFNRFAIVESFCLIFIRETNFQPGRIFTYIDSDPFNYSEEVFVLDGFDKTLSFSIICLFKDKS